MRVRRRSGIPQAPAEALADAGRWPEALRAYDAAAALVAKAHWRGQLLDGSALAAVGDLPAAADLLSKASGLGWSSEDHPGHLVFPLLAVLLATGAARKASEALLAELESAGRDVLAAFSDEDADAKPALAAPSIVALIQDAGPSIKMADADRDVAITAMRVAAETRVEGILGNSRRRHYGHAALLVASCLAFAPKSRETELSRWVADLRQQYSRRSAFREELTRAFASLGVAAPT